MDKNNKIKPDVFEGMSIFRPPLCHELTGKRFDLVMDDGNDVSVFFKDNETLLYGPADAMEDYPYDCLKMDDQVYFVNFEKHPFPTPRRGITLIMDLRESLVTEAFATLGLNRKFPRMPACSLVFGAIRREDGTIPSIRHGYAEEMVGTSIDWNYGSFNIAHVYHTPRYYRVAFTKRAIERSLRNNPEMLNPGGNNGSAPRPPRPRGAYEDYAEYVKVRDGLYIVSLLESNMCRRNGHGNSLLFLMNLNEMHDVGRSFGTNKDWEDENYTFGAFGTMNDATEVRNQPSLYYLH